MGRDAPPEILSIDAGMADSPLEAFLQALLSDVQVYRPAVKEEK